MKRYAMVIGVANMHRLRTSGTMTQNVRRFTTAKHGNSFVFGGWQSIPFARTATKRQQQMFITLMH